MEEILVNGLIALDLLDNKDSRTFLSKAFSGLCLVRGPMLCISIGHVVLSLEKMKQNNSIAAAGLF